LPGIESTEKDEMRQLALRGGPYTLKEKQDLTEYCEDDVRALQRLLPRLEPDLDLPRALLRGRYMAAAARMEATGIPVDVGTLARLRSHWDDLQGLLIAQVDHDYHVYEGKSFKADRWAAYLAREGIPWPRLESGNLALDDDTFREMSRLYPVVAPLRELRASLSSMRLERLAVGEDGRNRCLLSAFRARTSRNQPSNTQFIFGPSVWLRGLIRPEAGQGLAYLDWDQQEFGIAAGLSGDPAMISAYASGDAYMAFAQQAGAAPNSATKKTHRAIRDRFKATALAVQYGMGSRSLALRLGITEMEARGLLKAHHGTYPVFWKWSDAAVNRAMLLGDLFTTFGWSIRADTGTNPRSLRNFPMQANGAEMMRLAAILATEQGVAVCCPVHDALLVEAPLPDLEEVVSQTRMCMAAASRLVTGGLELRTEAEVVSYPDRYMDPRGARMWRSVMALLPALGPSTPSGGAGGVPASVQGPPSLLKR